MRKNHRIRKLVGVAAVLGTFGCDAGPATSGREDAATSSSAFQDGVSPTTAYAGTRDTMLEQNAPSATHGSDTSLSVSGDTPGGSGKDDSALVQWDLSTIPTDAVVRSATITVTVSDKAAQNYDLFELLRPWTETTASWNLASTGNAWATPGAFGATDRGSAALGTINAVSTGTKTITLNANGIAVVQKWIATPSTNFGVVFANATNDNRLEFRSSEYGTKSSRPKLTVSWDPAPPAGDGGATDSGTTDAGVSLVQTPGHYRQTCDGSGGVAIDATHFLDVNDETQQLRIFTQGADAAPVQTLDVSSAIGLSSGDEADLEEAARVGNRVYVISSHGRDKNGNLESMRYRFFAVDLAGSVPSVAMTVAGSDSNLLSDLLVSTNWDAPNADVIALIDSRSQLSNPSVASLAPKDQGTNVEGLAWLPTEGQTSRLVIGFRNPQYATKAILVTLLNADAVLGGATARFGQAFLFDLGGQGIRSLAWSTEHQALFLVSGPSSAANGPFSLWKWDGLSTTVPTKVQDLTGFPANSAPEAIIPYPGTTDLQILYDMGSFQIGGNDCKTVSVSSQYFTDIVLPHVP